MPYPNRPGRARVRPAPPERRPSAALDGVRAGSVDRVVPGPAVGVARGAVHTDRVVAVAAVGVPFRYATNGTALTTLPAAITPTANKVAQYAYWAAIG